MLSEVIFPNKTNLFSLSEWGDIEKRIKKYLEWFFSKESSKWKFNKFPHELIENSTNYAKDFKKVEKKREWFIENRLHYERNIGIKLIITKIKDGVNSLLELLYLEVVKELIKNGKEKNRIQKFEFHKNKLENEKEFYWGFFHFLIMKWHKNAVSNKLKAMNTLLSNNTEKYLNSFLSNYDLTDFDRKKAWILMFSSELWHKLEPKLYPFLHGLDDSLKHPFNIFTSIEDIYLGSNVGQNKEYDFSKIDFLLFYNEALRIKRLPLEIAIGSNLGLIRFTIRANWWIKLIPENILLFTL